MLATIQTLYIVLNVTNQAMKKEKAYLVNFNLIKEMVKNKTQDTLNRKMTSMKMHK